MRYSLITRSQVWYSSGFLSFAICIDRFDFTMIISEFIIGFHSVFEEFGVAIDF